MPKRLPLRQLSTIARNVKRRPLRTRPANATMVRRIIERTAEAKELYTSDSTEPVTTTGAVVCINQIAQGDDINNRTGKSIKTKQIDIQYRVASQTSNVNGVAQVALVHDSQPNGTNATYSQIFDSSNVNAGMCFRNTANFADRFKIYWCDQLPETETDDVATNGYTHRGRKFISLKIDDKRAEVRYGGTTAATPNTGAWYLIFGDGVNTTTNCTIQYTCKFQFTDM